MMATGSFWSLADDDCSKKEAVLCHFGADLSHTRLMAVKKKEVVDCCCGGCRSISLSLAPRVLCAQA